jgi:RNA polymerase sigma factor for flagellar operon FliA
MSGVTAERAYAATLEVPLADDPAALDQALRAHLPLVRKVVRRLLLHKPPHIESEELVNWGLDGLVQALRRFDPSKCVGFETYARTRIRGAILDRLRATDYMARSLRRRATRLQQAYQRLEAKLGRPATEDEVAAEMQMPLAELQQLLIDIGRSGSVGLEDLGEPPPQEQPPIESIVDPDRASPLDALLSRERSRLVADAIERLPEKEKRVIALYYHEGITMREVAELLGVTESRVSQLHSQALLRLSGHLNEYFGGEQS